MWDGVVLASVNVRRSVAVVVCFDVVAVVCLCDRVLHVFRVCLCILLVS